MTEQPQTSVRGERVSGLTMFWRFFLKPAILLFLVLVSLLVVWILVAPILSRRFVARAQAARPPGEPSIEDLASRFPATRVNSSARRLEELASTIGIDAATSQKTGRSRPDEATKAEFNQVKESLGTYLMNQIRRADDQQTAPPAALGLYRQRYGEKIEAIEDHLLRSETPQWEREPERPLEGPIPNLLGLLNLQKVFLLDALEKNRSGRRSEALRALGASWQLNRSLWTRPELICQLIAIVADRWEHRALRVLPEVPAEWEQKISSYETRKWLVTSLRMETWTMVEGVRRQPGETFGDLARGIRGVVFVPYLEMGMADFAERKERVVTDLMALGPCGFDLESHKRAWDRSPKKWNIPGRVAWPDSPEATRRLLRRGLDQELTVLILRLKRGVDLPNPVPSKICVGDSWRYRRSVTGRLQEIVLSRRIPEPIQERTWELPLRYFSWIPGGG